MILDDYMTHVCIGSYPETYLLFKIVLNICNIPYICDIPIKTTLVHYNLNKIIPYDYHHSSRIDNIYLPAKGKAGSAAPICYSEHIQGASGIVALFVKQI